MSTRNLSSHQHNYFSPITKQILLCKIKPKEEASDEAIAESSLAFWESLPPKGFTQHKAQDEVYHEKHT
jgi:hypothetical protein